jgi:hypothetical protein
MCPRHPLFAKAQFKSIVGIASHIHSQEYIPVPRRAIHRPPLYEVEICAGEVLDVRRIFAIVRNLANANVGDFREP